VPFDPAGPPLNEQLTDELRRLIEQGEWQPGERLPGERSLEERFEVSRTTVREALDRLRAEGLLTTGRRGTVVTRAQPIMLTLRHYHRRETWTEGRGPFETAIAEQGLEGEGQLIRVEQQVATAEMAGRLQVPEGSLLVVRRRHMRVEREIVQVQESLLPLELVKGTPLAGPAKVVSGIWPALAAIGHPPTSATWELQWRPATEDEQAVLRPGGRPPLIVVEILRTTRDDHGRPVEVWRVTAAADRHRIVFEDRPID
jgi:GntR family transcriptional regulator